MDITQGRVQKKSSLKISFEIHSQNLYKNLEKDKIVIFRRIRNRKEDIYSSMNRKWSVYIYIYIYLETTSSTPSTPGSIHRSSFMSLGKKISPIGKIVFRGIGGGQSRRKISCAISFRVETKSNDVMRQRVYNAYNGA